MSVVITVLHVIVCVFLVAVVLLQRGKGAQVGAVFGGGGGATMFGGRGAGNFLTKLTTASAVLFMVLAFSLARFAADNSADDLLEVPASDAPAQPETKTAPEPESSAPPSEPGGAPSGFETIETPAAPPATAPESGAPSPAPAPAKPPS